MALTIVEWLTNLLTVYAAMGVLFALAFVTAGVQAIDPAAKESGMGFRIIIFPGVAALWPLMISRWVEARRGHRVKERHE